MATLFVSASDTLSVSDNAAYNYSLVLPTASGISLTEGVVQNLKAWSTGQTLDLADNIVVVADIIPISADNGLDLYDTASAVGGFTPGIASDQIELTQNAKSSILGGGASSSFWTLTDWANAQAPISLEVSTNISAPVDELLNEDTKVIPGEEQGEAIEEALKNVGLRDSVALRNIVLNLNVQQYISFAHPAVANAIELSVGNHIPLTQTAESVEYEQINDVVQVTHSVTGTTAHAAFNFFQPWSSQVFAEVVRTLNVSSDLNLTDENTDGATVRSSDYASANLIGNALCASPFTRRSTILLTYPYPNWTRSVELRNPVFGDAETYEFKRINRLTRGGTLKVFRDPAWPLAERLTYNFDNLKQEDIKNFLWFLQASLGKEIGILDFESRQWRGFIITPETPGSAENTPGFDLSFQFEGVQDPGAADTQLQALLSGSGSLPMQLSKIPPGLQASIGSSGQLVGNVLRD